MGPGRLRAPRLDDSEPAGFMADEGPPAEHACMVKLREFDPHEDFDAGGCRSRTHNLKAPLPAAASHFGQFRPPRFAQKSLAEQGTCSAIAASVGGAEELDLPADRLPCEPDHACTTARASRRACSGPRERRWRRGSRRVQRSTPLPCVGMSLPWLVRSSLRQPSMSPSSIRRFH